MHNLKELVENLEQFKENLSKRHFDVSILDQMSSLDSTRRRLTSEVESNRAEIKKISKEVGILKQNGESADQLMQQVAQLKSSSEKATQDLEKCQEQLHDLGATIPNTLFDEVPSGKSEEENQEIFKSGSPRKFSFSPKDHVDLGENLEQLDFQTAAKITGARFVLYRGKLARLERALINFMLDRHGENGYTEMIPPFIVHERSLFGTGQLPKFKEDLFKLEGTQWYLIPTSEVPLTNIKRESLFDAKELPLLSTAYTPCFRSEAGSYGKDTRGIIRQHQFNKVELVNIVESDKSPEAHEQMILRARAILDELELPYRGVLLCSGDTGFSAKKTIDIEVWLPGQNKYREISSISNCGDFQARRAQIRYRNSAGKPEFAHTLNGSGVAVGRALVAVMENYQNEDGSIEIPKALIPYMGGLNQITKD